jgi:hypothetical protein
MSNRINLQILISYLGLLPFIIIILDKFFFNQFNPNVLKDFCVFYSVIIFVFIGALNWNLGKNISIMQVLMGFIPSLFSVFIIVLYLGSYDVFLLIIIFFLSQLVLDNFVYKTKLEKRIYMILRTPLTFLIIISLILIQL